MAKNRSRISVEGAAKDKGHVRLTDFLKQLESVRKALHQTESILHRERTSVYYRIIDAHRSSPLTVVLEAVDEQGGELPQQVVGKFLDSIGEIKKLGVIPFDFDYPTATAYKEIAAPQ